MGTAPEITPFTGNPTPSLETLDANFSNIVTKFDSANGFATLDSSKKLDQIAPVAEDVSASINGHAISSIFEADGVTPKVATALQNLSLPGGSRNLKYKYCISASPSINGTGTLNPVGGVWHYDLSSILTDITAIGFTWSMDGEAFGLQIGWDYFNRIIWAANVHPTNNYTNNNFEFIFFSVT